MENTKQITKVEINGLWNRIDIDWKLNSDVNILSGENGTGKSTILSSIYNSLIKPLPTQDYLFGRFSKMKLTFNTEEIELNCADTFVEFNGKLALGQFLNSNPKYSKYIYWYSSEDSFTVRKGGITFIKILDTYLKSQEAVQKLSSNEVKTDLDWEISKLQNKYLDYQINISKRKDEIVENSNNPKKDINKLNRPLNLFKEIINLSFGETSKKIDDNKNEIAFLVGDKEILPFQLSTGEKHLLLILLNILVQDNKPSILLIDEIDASLHFDWQNNIIGYIRKLNPNCQLIVSTHSPAIIMDGWLDKVTDIQDISEISKNYINKNEKTQRKS